MRLLNIITDKEAKELYKLEKTFIKSYLSYKDKMELNDWLSFELKKHLTDKNDEDIKNISNEIIETLVNIEENKASLRKAMDNGRSKESWFESTLRKSNTHMSISDYGNYLFELDNVVAQANEALISEITNQSGNISMNPNLDGFIAEHNHVNSFNMEATLKGSEYRAGVLQPKPGEVYGKNSVDIVIKDGTGKIVRKYQSKYCKDSSATENAFKSGDYRGQRKLIPDGQDVDGGVTQIESPDGKIKSNKFSKEDAKQHQNEIQNGKYKPVDWNNYNTKELALNIGKEASKNALYGAGISVGFYIAQKAIEGEDIEANEVVEVALKSGADIGVKSAIAGAIKVGAEKGIIKVIPKGTPAGIIVNIVNIGIENARICKKVIDGELTVKEALDEMEINTVSMVCGMVAAGEGAAIGGTIGSVLGPLGTIVGGFLGGTIGYMAGSEVGKVVTKGAQKVREVVRETVTNIASSVKEVASRGLSSVSNGLRSLLPL